MRTLCLFLTLWTIGRTYAQLWEQADQRSEEIRLDRALPVGGGRWAVIGKCAFAGCHMISVVAENGSVVWEDLGNYGIGVGYGDVTQMPDSGLLHVGIYDGCDYLGPDSRVRRFASDGTILWELYITPWQAYPPVMAAEGTSSRIAVASQDSVLILDMDGTAVGGFAVASSNLQDVLWGGDSTLFLHRGVEVERVGLDGAELASVVIGSNVADIHWDGQQLFVLANDSVRRYDQDLFPLGNTLLTDLDGNSGFVTADSSLYVRTTNGIHQLADDGSSTFLFPWPALPALTTTGCAVRNGTVLSVGNTNITDRSTGIVRTLSMGGVAVQHDQDVEVMVQVDSAWTEYTGLGFYPWERKADLTGYVVNHGADTLHSVVLSMWVQVPFLLCGQIANRIDTAGIAVAPGDTLSLPFGVVDVALGLTTNQASNITGHICIVALAPDRLADRDPTDNTACATVDFVLGSEDRKTEDPVSVFPNPVIDRCLVSGLDNLGSRVRLRILDSVTRVVTERFSNIGSDRLELDLSTLPSGMYFLEAEGTRSRSVRNLVITHPW